MHGLGPVHQRLFLVTNPCAPKTPIWAVCEVRDKLSKRHCVARNVCDKEYENNIR